MKMGLLWYDNSPKDLSEKVRQAARRYKQKFGEAPDTCYVHKSATDEELQVGNVCVIPLRTVLPGHLWIGNDDRKESKISR